MTREEFTTEYACRMRFVIQKHDRVNEAERVIRKCGTRPSREESLKAAHISLDAAVGQLADHVYDAMASGTFS